MASKWEDFIRNAVRGEEDEPFVRLLRERVRSGYRVLRVNFSASSGERATPEYILILERLAHLSEMRVPHSPSFTRWSLGEGIRMASSEEEAARFGLLALERHTPLIERWGISTFRSLFVERIRVHGPPRTVARLENVKSREMPLTGHKIESLSQLDEVLASLAQDFVSRLQYSEADAADILDQALAAFCSSTLKA
jgi:hypothetical protein